MTDRGIVAPSSSTSRPGTAWENVSVPEARLAVGTFACRHGAVTLLVGAVVEHDLVARLNAQQTHEEAGSPIAGVDMPCEHDGAKCFTGQGSALPPADLPGLRRQIRLA